MVQFEHGVLIVRGGIRETGELLAVEAAVRADLAADAEWLVRAMERATASARHGRSVTTQPEFDFGGEGV
jgi:hypothetical protein